MNATVARALLEDAFAQVLDNRVFRILLILVALLVALTFLIGLREEGLVLTWGLKTIAYEDLPGWLLFGSLQLDAKALSGAELQQAAIGTIQSFFVGTLAGTLGMVVTISATAFFVPRMVEKGAADTLFSKALPRWVLYLSRYFTGLLFVALLSGVLVGGMHLGFLINSGYSDPGFLWGALTLTYLFALIYPVVMAIGVWTRSTVASILLGLLFFMGNGCLAQQTWMLKEHLVWMYHNGYLQNLVEESGGQGSSSGGVTVSRDGHPEEELAPEAGAEGDEGEEHVGEEIAPFFRWLIAISDAVHFPLPKTTDADFLTAMLRRSLEGVGPVFFDLDSGLAIEGVPAGLEVLPIEQLGAPSVPLASADDEVEALFGMARLEGPAPARVVVFRRPAGQQPSLRSGGRPRPETARRAAELLAEALIERGAAVDTSTRYVSLGEQSARSVDWMDAAGERWGRTLLFSRPGWIYAVDIVADGQRASPAEGEGFGDESDPGKVLVQGVQDVLALSAQELRVQNTELWYADRFGWDSELRYNAFFSIGSSLAFTIVVLLLGWWKLRRIDF